MQKRKVGRPKGTTKPDSRKAYLTIRLTDEEKAKIKREAENLGVPIIDMMMMFYKFYKENQK
jgi:antitoxin component of RelBE/YafQ-DinJ toxin-antitoxin module